MSEPIWQSNGFRDIVVREDSGYVVIEQKGVEPIILLPEEAVALAAAFERADAERVGKWRTHYTVGTYTLFSNGTENGNAGDWYILRTGTLWDAKNTLQGSRSQLRMAEALRRALA